MKKRILSLVLVFAMTAAFIPQLPAGAYNMGKVGEYQTISAGDFHTAAIKADGSLWTWGFSGNGQLGDGMGGNYDYKSTPIKIMDNVVAVSAGYGHTAAIKSDGSLWTWGLNNHGQLGDGTTENKYTPVKIMDNVIAVSAGGWHTAAIKSDGSLWTWGRNNGQLGDGTTEDKYTPVKIMDNVIAVSAAHSNTAAIKSDGSLWTWGSNWGGQLGDGTTEDKYTPVKIMDNVAAVSAGDGHTAAIKSDGSLWTWRCNGDGQLGDGTTENKYTPVKIMDNIAAVSAGNAHAAAIKSDGSLWAWGSNYNGQLGDGTTEYKTTPVKIMDNVAAVSAGDDYTATIKSDGSLWTWGLNNHGQLGDGTTDDKSTPVKIMDGVQVPEGGVQPSGTQGNTNSTSSGAPIITSATAYLDNDKYDMFFADMNITEGSTVEMGISTEVDNNGCEDVHLYLTQGTGKKQVKIELIPGEDKVIRPGQVFKGDEDVYITAIDKKTGKSTSKKTRLKIDNAFNAKWDSVTGIKGSSFKLGNNVKFTVPDKVPVFANMEIDLDLDFIPFCVEYESDDKINIAVGIGSGNVDETTGKFKGFSFTDWKSEIKESIKKGKNSIIEYDSAKNNKSLNKRMKEKYPNLQLDPVKFNVTKGVKTSTDVSGYVEWRKTDAGWKVAEGQILLEATVKYTYQGQVIIWVIPCYYEVGVGIGAGVEGNIAKLDPKTLKPTFSGYLTANLSGELGAGVGIANAATIGAAGEGSLNVKTALTKRYIKSWGEGEASLKIKVLGKEWKYPFANGTFLIYETGNNKGLIKDKNGIELSSLDEPYSTIDINSVYENESRAYAANPAEWRGSEPEINLMTADYTNKDLKLLAENVYTESAPQICEIDGKKVMVTQWDNTDRADADRTMLVYSVYDNTSDTWSKPTAVDDDGTADFYPCFRDGYLVWQNSKTTLSDDMTLKEIAQTGEICAAKWNGSGFDEPTVITDNNSLDTLPMVAATAGGASVVWVTNTEDDILGITGKNSIMRADFDGTTWSAAKAVKESLNAVTNITVSTVNNKFCVAYVADDDNDLNTINDRDIRIISDAGFSIRDIGGRTYATDLKRHVLIDLEAEGFDMTRIRFRELPSQKKRNEPHANKTHRVSGAAGDAGAGRGDNREWEVGYRGDYDRIDDESALKR